MTDNTPLIEELARAIGAAMQPSESAVPGTSVYVPWEWQREHCTALAQALLPIITRREEQARAEGLGIAAADVKTWFPGDSIDKPLSVAGKSLYDSILAKRKMSNG